jgi:hypothetical protein
MRSVFRSIGSTVLSTMVVLRRWLFITPDPDRHQQFGLHKLEGSLILLLFLVQIGLPSIGIQESFWLGAICWACIAALALHILWTWEKVAGLKNGGKLISTVILVAGICLFTVPRLNMEYKREHLPLIQSAPPTVMPAPGPPLVESKELAKVPTAKDIAVEHHTSIEPTFRTQFSATTFEQFPEETMIGGLPFNRGEIAVHFYAFVDRSDVEDLSVHIWLVHRGGRITGISGIGPISTCPGAVVSQPTSSGVTPQTMTVVGGKSAVAVPLNSTSSVGNFLAAPGGSWLIHCDKVLKGMAPDFIIRVLRPISNKNQLDPLRWRLLDALVAQGTYKTKSGKEVKFINIAVYDDDGNPRPAGKNEAEEILKRGPAGATTFYLPTRPR